ncbi:MAG TPA: pyridoxamine 5'-phosphate oxidase family protein [Streptosporangiaceae bacterium]|nr:pyridoxamine 5'-phosphate oxidase family protein [Streptosporangiaceae bacterium]
MYETEAELDELQAMLDASLSRSTAHLQSIVKPGERTLRARQLVRVITGMCTLALSTVTATCEPRVSAVDGHFLHGRWIFTTARSAAKATHLGARPAASVAYLRGEEVGVFTHGAAELLNPAGGPDDPEWPAILDHLTAHYGQSPMNWGDVVGYRLRPHWMVAFASDPSALMATYEPSA